MSDHIKRRGADIASVLAIAIFSHLAIFKLGAAIDETQLWLIPLFVCLPIAVYYRNQVFKYFTILTLGLVSTSVLMAVYAAVDEGAEFWEGPGPVFVILLSLVQAWSIGKGGVVAFILVKGYYLLIGDRVPRAVGRIVSPLVLLVCLAAGGLFVGKELVIYNASGKAETDKTEFIKRVSVAIGDGKLKQFTNQELIDLGIPSGIYQTDGTKIINSYGGEVEIKNLGSMVSLVYAGIPAGEKCYHFYFMNDPGMYGFNITRVDGVSKNSGTPTNTESIEEFERKACYSGKESVTIEFAGLIQNISDNSYWARSEESRTKVPF